MEELIEYILQFGNLNKQQIELVISKGQILQLKKEDYFSEAGKIPKQVGFIIEGVIRGCYYNNKGEEITRCFISAAIRTALRAYSINIKNVAPYGTKPPCNAIPFIMADIPNSRTP